MKKWLIRLTKIELVLIYLVIIAGSVVRMTGSGMGCPDWPKCFGYLIPPTERAQLEWQPHRSFEKGQIIIVDESLRVAESDFTTGNSYDESNWAPYTKHDYAQFNAFHTWTEYINRLCGALSGIPMLLLVLISGLYVRKNWRYFPLALLGLFMLGFEAWLGKLVVDGNLIPGSITIHMMSALLIVALLLLLRGMLLKKEFQSRPLPTVFKGLLLVSILLTLFQIGIGTQVREQVDQLDKIGIMRGNWIANLNWEFYVHRSFSLVVLALNFWLWRTNKKNQFGFRELNAVLGIIVLEIIFGIILTYVNMPKFAQPTHLLLGMLLFGFQFFALMRMWLYQRNKNLREVKD